MSGLYCVFKRGMMGKAPASNFVTLSDSASIRAALIQTTYTFDVAAQTTSLSASLALASRTVKVGENAGSSTTSDTVLANTSITSSNGITTFDADNVIFPSVSAGLVIHGILIYRRLVDDTDSLPIAFINIATVTSNGATINVNWDNGVNRIFALTG